MLMHEYSSNNDSEIISGALTNIKLRFDLI
jgi:hypothetical protein